MTNHTPGPWKVSRRFDIYQDTQTPGVGGTFVASTKGISELPESINQVCEADAKLIAAAPELLAACESALRIEDLWMPCGLDDHDEAAAICLMRNQFVAATRKAKGESE